MIENLMRDNIKNLEAYNPKTIEGVIKLDSNENNFVLHEINHQIAKVLLEAPLNQYPDSNGRELKEILARKQRVSTEQVGLGCGSDQLIMMILKAFINQGDKIITIAPTFSMYKVSNQIVGGETVEVPLEDGFTFNYLTFLQAIKRENPKVVFISNPNNPTGGVIPREQIIKIIELSNAVVVVDEAYFEFYGKSVVDLVNYYPNLVVLRTLSKAYGLAGARIGYSIASKKMTAILNRVKPPYNISTLDQIAAKICLENSHKLEAVIDKIIQERSLMMKELKKIEGIEVYNSYGNFVLIKTNKSKEIHRYLIDQNISIRYFGEVGCLKGYLRISVGNEVENIKLINTLRDYLQEGANESSLKIAR